MPEDHPLRAIRLLVNAALDRLSPAFASIYADTGRPSIPPEKLLRALLLQALFTIRSERQLMQQITYNMLFRWFVGLAMDVPVWDVTVSPKIVIVCWKATSRAASWEQSSLTRRSGRCCRPSTSRWMEH